MATFCCRNVCSFTASFFFFFFAFLSLSSHAADTLTSSQSIRDGETLISANSTFELGFFSPRNSTNRYVGIWFYNISEQTTVWIANRENPLSDSSGVFRIDESGNLIISNGRGIVFWSANITSNSSIAQLKDTGNLVIVTTLALDAGRLLWQSFDHPTETFLPGMEIGLNLRTGVNQIFTSWKSSNDPSAGNFTLGVDPLGSVQIFMWRGSKPRWRSGEWNGQVFTGVPNMRFLYLYGFNLNNDVEGGRRYFTFAAYNSSRVRFETTPEGLVRQMLWDEENERWAVSWQQPLNVCDVYGTCGPFGSCNILESPMCSCLEGFVPRNGDEWGAGNWTGGCVRRTELGCGRNISGGESDGFLKIDGVKLPDKSDWRVDIRNIEECQASCLNNCTCRAYAYVSGIGCMKWGVDLIDIQKFSGDGNDLYVRLAGSEIGGKRSNISMIIIIVIIVVGLIFSVTCIYIMWRFRAKLKGLWKKEHVREASIFDLGHSRENHSTDISGPSDLGEEGKQGNTSELPVFSFNYVAVATNKFSDANKLGEGGFGAVYKGKLTGGEEIAVKRLSTKSGQGREEFMNEAILIAKLQHRNLVRLLGCCIQWEEKMLIYEYMPNKSLDSFIFDPAKQGLLDWKKRFNIIEGIARGLLYLHRDSRLRIIHRDLKASNILLDEEMNPKISDFGMAKIFGGDQNHANTNRVVGTYGYMSPEYAMEGLFSVKSDVYSFGVLLLEIVCGKKNTSFHNSENYRNLLEYAWKLWKEDKALELIDPSLGDTYSIREVLRCIHVGLLCVQDHTMDRPTMSSVVLMLESELAAHPTPSQPTFSMRRSPTATTAATSSLEQTPENFSTNDVTISVIVGR